MNTYSEQFRFECMCREWIKRIKANGWDWWRLKKIELRKKWGAERLQKLIDGMNAERKNSGS